jgi:hypothetical protein
MEVAGTLRDTPRGGAGEDVEPPLDPMLYQPPSQRRGEPGEKPDQRGADSDEAEPGRWPHGTAVRTSSRKASDRASRSSA